MIILLGITVYGFVFEREFFLSNEPDSTFIKISSLILGVCCLFLSRLVIVDKEKISDYAVEAVSFLKDNGIISGDEHGRFNPNSSATRAEAAKIVYNAKTFFEKN